MYIRPSVVSSLVVVTLTVIYLCTQMPPELMKKLDGKKKAYPDNTLGLLRFIRNLHEH